METVTISKYSSDSLELLQTAFSHLLEGLANFSANNPRAAIRDVVKKITISDKGQVWQKLKEIYDDSSLFEVYSADSNPDPIQVLLSIYNSMDEVHTGLLANCKDWEDREAKLLEQIDDLRDQNETMKQQAANLEHRIRLETSTHTSHENTVSLLEEQLKKKDEHIAKLQKGDNVALWEKEKERAFEQHISRETELKEQLESKEREFELKCERYEKKIEDYILELRRYQTLSSFITAEDLQNSSKTQKITGELDKTIHTDSTTVNRLKREVYYLGKDLLSAETELNRLQAEISGILQGLERDFRIVHHKMVDNKEVTMKHLSKLADWLSNLQAGFRDGNSSPVLSTLPDYYRVVDRKKLKTIKVRKAFANLTSTSTSTSSKNLEQMVKSLEKEVWQIETDSTIENLEHKQTNGGAAATNIAHPELVYSNGKVNTTALIKHFPALSVPFVQEQWNNFRRYDRNGDGTLDLAEMMTAITATLGHRFTAQEVVEVMTEVDDDKSSTLDFYEYLKVSILIMKKTGQSSLLQDDEVTKNKKALSKTCLVQ